MSHGVHENEVEDILASPGEDRPGRDGSRVAIGRTSGGRYLRVSTCQTKNQTVCL